MVFGHEPLTLLITQPLTVVFKCLWRIVGAYLKRLDIEETIRYIKTCCDLENERMLDYQGLQNQRKRSPTLAAYRDCTCHIVLCSEHACMCQEYAVSPPVRRFRAERGECVDREALEESNRRHRYHE